MKAIDFINFICDMYEVDKAERKERIEKYSKMFEMTDNLNDEISSFSHGMKQKVALISALAHNPKILIMDEPFVELDPKAVFDMKEIMKQMCKEGKIVKVGKMSEIKGDESLEQVFLELDEKDSRKE